MHRANGFFLAAAAGAGDSGDADAQHASRAVADAVGEGGGYFGADRAFGLNQCRGHVGPGSFQFIAVADHATEKIRGATGDAGEALGKESAGAAFRGGNCGVVQNQQMRDDLIE